MNPVDDFLKHAGFMDLIRGIGAGLKGSLEPLERGVQRLPGEQMGRIVGQVGIPALAAGGLAAIGHGASKGIDAIVNRFGKARDYKAMLQAHPSLAQADAGTTQMYFNSLRHVAPSLSKDPLVAGSFIRNMMELQPESGPAIPIQTTKLLTDAQKSISQAKGSHPISEAFAGGKPSFYEPRMDPPPSPPMPRLVGEKRYGIPPEGSTGPLSLIGETRKEYE